MSTTSVEAEIVADILTEPRHDEYVERRTLVYGDGSIVGVPPELSIEALTVELGVSR